VYALSAGLTVVANVAKATGPVFWGRYSPLFQMFLLYARVDIMI